MSESHDAPTSRQAQGEHGRPETTADAELFRLIFKHQRHCWRRGECVPVEAYLAQDPQLQGDAQAILDLIYQEIVLREEAGESPQLEEYVRRFPELAAELELQFELERAIQDEPTAGGDEHPTTLGGAGPRPAPTIAPVLPGYQILGELGRGGMGVVYKARQLRLNRIVALKMILAGDYAPAETIVRFMAEAESIARVHHPHIVQIFAYGDHDGRPYFEMEYVDGGSLADRLGGKPWPLRDAAGLVETLARAIHAAHALGVVHRDLKPANILLTNDGIPKIADFGLAKCLDTETGLTRTEWIVGSPSYMAPEQAGEGGRPIGPMADVYSLGAILYELITGRPPFRAATILETLGQVRTDLPMAPARLRRGLPRDLATICLKCLEKDPARRYGSAAELAEDLRRFEAGEAIRARPAGAHERLWRWCRREPAVASMALALLAGLVGVATQWRRAESHLNDALHQRGRAELHLRDARQQQRRAEENERKQLEANHALQLANDRERTASRRAQQRFDAAMTALRKFEDITKNEALLREPHLDGLRASLLQTALGFYSEFQASLEEDGSPAARSDLVEAYGRAAQLTWELGRQDEALAAHRRALAMVERMAAATTHDPEIRSALARCHTRIGFTLRTMGRPAEARQSYVRARAILEPLVRDHSGIARHREHLSFTLSNLGVIEQDLGQTGEAIRLHRQALEIHEGLLRHQPGTAQYRNDLGWCWRYLCQAVASTGDLVAALRAAERAVALYQELVREDRRVEEFRWRLARSLDEKGRIGSLSGRLADAAEALERAAEIHEALARDNPGFYGVDIIRNRLYAAGHRLAAGRPEEARACLRRAEDELKRAHRVRPEMLLHDLACSHILWSAAGREGTIGPAEREARTQRAIAVLRRAVIAGHADLMQVRRDPVLDPLRRRLDFEEMILDLSFPADPFRS
jgi:tetratricopeptide (TPR) repeat protein/tRNA A-37 threonylcarbamoyl transferase component Bud32